MTWCWWRIFVMVNDITAVEQRWPFIMPSINIIINITIVFLYAFVPLHKKTKKLCRQKHTFKIRYLLLLVKHWKSYLFCWLLGFYFTFKSFLKYKQFKTVYFSSIFLVTLDEARVCLSWVQYLWSEFTFQLVDNKHRKIQIEFQVFLQSIHFSILTIGTSSFFHCPCMKYFKIPLQIWFFSYFARKSFIAATASNKN